MLHYSARFKHECVVGSGIDPMLYHAAVTIIEDRGLWEPNQALGHAIRPFWQTRKPHNFGVLAAFCNENEKYWQGKPERPRIDPKKGKEIKYETILGIGSCAFLPAVDVETWVRIAKRHHLLGFLPSWVKRAIAGGRELFRSNFYQKLTPDKFEDYANRLKANYSVRTGRDSSPLREVHRLQNEFPIETSSFWQWVELLSFALPIIITEGGKKSLSLLTQGYVAIGLYGVNGGYRSTEKIGGETLKLVRPELIADLKPFCKPGRQIILAFDQDVKPTTVERVNSAIWRFGGLIAEAGAQVSVASWSPQFKGIDDLIVGAGAAAADAALASATGYEEWSLLRQLSRRVRRQPDLDKGEAEFDTADIPETGIAVLYGGKGTGKSKAIGGAIANSSWLSVTHLQSLASGQAETWNGAWVNEADKHGSTFLKDGKPVNGISVCVPSLLAVKGMSDGVTLILDEATRVLDFLLSSNLANKDGARPHLIADLIERIRQAKRVILADADITEEVIRWVESIRGEKAFLIRSKRKPLSWTGHLIESRDVAIAELLVQAKEAAEASQMILAASDSKALVDTLSLVLEQQGIKTLKITQETVGGDLEREFKDSGGANLRLLQQMGVTVILCSPSIAQGTSIEHNLELFHSMHGIYEGVSISADSIAQQLDRLRSSDIPRYFYVPQRGRAYSKLSRATASREFLRDVKQGASATLRLVRHALKADVADKAGAIDWQCENLKLLSSFGSAHNQGMRQLRSTVLALLKLEGKEVLPFRATVTKQETTAANQSIKAARRTQRQQEAIAVATALDLNSEQVEAIERKARNQALDKSEQYALQKFYLSQFYRSPVNAALVEFDNRSKTRSCIRRLEELLNSELALNHCVRSIERNPTTPQDWSKAVLQPWLLEQSGAIEVILKAYQGEVVELTPEIVSSVATVLKRHTKEFQVAFGFSNLQSVSDQQAVGTLLDFYGLKRKACFRRVNGTLMRVYAIDQEHLAALRATIVQRSQIDTPPQEDLFIKGGVSEEALADLRSMLATADTKEAQEAVRTVAIALGYSPDIDLQQLLAS